MHIIKLYQTTITLFNREGRVSQFPSLKAAARELGVRWISRNVGEHFRSYSHTSRVHTEGAGVPGESNAEQGVVYEKHYREYDYVMRNDAGEPITHAAFWSLDRVAKRYRRSFDRWDDGTPVPHTGKRRAGRHYYRRPQLVNAVRAAETFEAEGEVAQRAKRGAHILPSRWGGPRVASRADRNWKSFRGKQWK